MTSKSRKSNIIHHVSLKDALESYEYTNEYYSTDPFNKRIEMLNACLYGIQKSRKVLLNWNPKSSIENFVYFLNYFTFLIFCYNHMTDLLNYLNEHVCKYKPTDYSHVFVTIKKVLNDKEKWENLNIIIQDFLNTIRELDITKFNAFLLDKARKLYEARMEILTSKIFMDNNSIFMINLKYNTLYTSAIQNMNTFQLTDITKYINDNQNIIIQNKNINVEILTKLSNIKSLQSICQDVLVSNPKLFLKTERVYKDHFSIIYPEFIDNIFQNLLPEIKSKIKSVPLPSKKVKNVTRNRSYGGRKNKTRYHLSIPVTDLNPHPKGVLHSNL